MLHLNRNDAVLHRIEHRSAHQLPCGQLYMPYCSPLRTYLRGEQEFQGGEDTVHLQGMQELVFPGHPLRQSILHIRKGFAILIHRLIPDQWLPNPALRLVRRDPNIFEASQSY